MIHTSSVSAGPTGPFGGSREPPLGNALYRNPRGALPLRPLQPAMPGINQLLQQQQELRQRTQQNKAPGGRAYLQTGPGYNATSYSGSQRYSQSLSGGITALPTHRTTTATPANLLGAYQTVSLPYKANFTHTGANQRPLGANQWYVQVQTTPLTTLILRTRTSTNAAIHAYSSVRLGPTGELSAVT